MSLPTILALAMAAQAGDSVVVRVDDAVVTAADVKNRVAEFRARGVPVSQPVLIDNLVAEALLAAEARRPGALPPRVLQVAIGNERQRILADEFAERSLATRFPVTDEQVRSLFHQGDGVRLNLLLFTSADDARASRDRLAVSNAWSVEAANSLAKAKYPKGETPMLTRIQLDPALAEAAFKAPLKKLMGPLELSIGWAVFSVIARDVGDEALLAKRRPALEAMARTQNLSSIRKHYSEGRRKQAKITVDDAFFEKLGKRLAVSDAEARHPVAVVNGRAISYDELAPRLRGLGGAAGGHMSGPAVKRQILTQFIEERLLADAAVAESLDKSPAVAASLRRGEIRLLASMTADSIRASQKNADAAEKALVKRVNDLRKRARIQVDDAAIAAALNG